MGGRKSAAPPPLGMLKAADCYHFQLSSLQGRVPARTQQFIILRAQCFMGGFYKPF